MFRYFEGLVDPFASPASAIPPPGAWRFLLSHLAPYRRIIVASLVLTSLLAVSEVWIIAYAGHLVDLLAGTRREALWTDFGLEFILVGLFVLIAQPVLKFLRETLHDVGLRPNLVGQIRWRAHRHVLGQSVGWFQSDFAGRIAGRVRDAGVSGAGTVYTCLHSLSYVVVYLIASAGYLLLVDPRLVIPLLVWVALYLGLMVYTVPRFRSANEAFQKALSAQTGMMVDTYTNIETIKMFAAANADDPEGRALFEATRQTFFKVQRLEVTINIGMAALGSLLMVALVGYALVLWQQGAAPLGLVAASLALSVRITAMAEWMLDGVAALFGWLGGLRDSLSAIAQPLAIADRAGAVELPEARGAIVFTDVRHHYGKGKGGIAGVSLTIAPGSKVGLVGPSGAGKSTLVRLLQRFFDMEGGAIEIGGHDIRAVTQASLRRQIGVVAQEPALLHRSVRDNIAFGRTDVGEAEVVAAARRAMAHDFILGLRDAAGRSGYDAHVGERGVMLSGGQRQRIALARAFLKDAPILILDEATSALDSEVEAAIQDSLDGMMAGKTVIAIAHRLSTIARLDRIVVLDKGRIVEAGSHDELLAAGGLYARLWTRQSGGFLGLSAD